MKKMRFNYRWLKEMAMHDPEIRALVKFFIDHDCRFVHNSGLNKLMEVLHEEHAPNGYIEILWNSYRKFLWKKSHNQLCECEESSLEKLG